MPVEFATSTFVPAALGFFGLGTGYLIWGPQELFGFPRRTADVDRSLGVWGIFLPGLCQLITGLILFVGLTWLQVFKDKSLYMAALAFSAYGIHWFALGWNRYRGNDPAPNAGMSVAFTILSVLGAVVFFSADAWALGVLFVRVVRCLRLGLLRRSGCLRLRASPWFDALADRFVVDVSSLRHSPEHHTGLSPAGLTAAKRK